MKPVVLEPSFVFSFIPQHPAQRDSSPTQSRCGQEDRPPCTPGSQGEGQSAAFPSPLNSKTQRLNYRPVWPGGGKRVLLPHSLHPQSEDLLLAQQAENTGALIPLGPVHTEGRGSVLEQAKEEEPIASRQHLTKKKWSCSNLMPTDSPEIQAW